MCNIEQLETHLTDLQKQIGKLYDRKGIDPLHLFHLTIYSTTEKVFDIIFDDMEEVEGDDYFEFKNLVMGEMERAFIDATNNQKRKRRIL